MPLNNSMSITPSSPGQAKGERFEHGSVLGGKNPWHPGQLSLEINRLGRLRRSGLISFGRFHLRVEHVAPLDESAESLLKAVNELYRSPWIPERSATGFKRSGFERPFQARQSRLGMAS